MKSIEDILNHFQGNQLIWHWLLLLLHRGPLAAKLEQLKDGLEASDAGEVVKEGDGSAEEKVLVPREYLLAHVVVVHICVLECSVSLEVLWRIFLSH